MFLSIYFFINRRTGLGPSSQLKIPLLKGWNNIIFRIWTFEVIFFITHECSLKNSAIDCENMELTYLLELCTSSHIYKVIQG